MTTATATQPDVIDAPNGQLATQAAKKYNPLSPVGTAGGLKDMLEKMKGSIAQTLPRHITPERLIKTLLTAANRNPALLECTQASVMETIFRAAELGLDLSGTLGEAYPVPFNNKIKVPNGQGGTTEQWRKTCQLIIGYRGLEKLAWQSGEIQTIDAEVVCQNDRFIFRKGFEPALEWEPSRGERGEPIGAYALIITKAGGRMARFMTREDIEKVRQGAQSKDSPAWRNHWSEMARKTVLRRVMKDAPLSTEKLVAALEHDDTDHGHRDVLEAALNGLPSGRGSFTAPAPEPEPEPEGDATPIADEVAEQSAKLDERRAAVKAADEAAAKSPASDATGAPVEGNQPPTRSKEEIAADLERAKKGCRIGLPGCCSDISVDKKTKRPVCANHAASST